MRHRHSGCHPRGHIEIDLPEALFGMGRGRSGGWGPFHFEFDDKSWGGGGRRGGRGRRMFESGELRLVLLKLIADEPRHGYDLIRAIEDLTAGEGSRKPFQATAEGKAHLEEKSDEIDALFERLNDLKPRESHGGATIGRATQNLMAAIRNRVSRHGWDEELTHEVTAILDEAAQRIERLKN